MAYRAGVSLRTLRKIEQEQIKTSYVPRYETAVKLSRVVGVEASDIEEFASTLEALGV